MGVFSPLEIEVINRTTNQEANYLDSSVVVQEIELAMNLAL